MLENGLQTLYSRVRDSVRQHKGAMIDIFDMNDEQNYESHEAFACLSIGHHDILPISSFFVWNITESK